MYKIRRVNISDVILLCRCYGNQRNRPNHYETLEVQSNSSQKEIRDAFLKLSKELHPDIGNKGSHAEFVKLNEAYKILSKDHSRRQHDMDLKYQSASAHSINYRYSDRAFYHDPVDFKSRSKETEAKFAEDYYGIKGVKRMPNWKVALICVTICAIIVTVELIAIRNAYRRNREYLKNRSLKAEQDYDEIRARVDNMTREEQMEAIQKKYDAQNGHHGLL